MSDVSLATFFVYDKESTATFRPTFRSREADVVVAAAVAGAEAAAVAVEVAAAVEAVEAAVVVAGVQAAAGVERGLRRLRCVCRMCSRLVGHSAATANVCLSADEQAAIDTIKAGPQRRPCRNAARH